MKAIILIAGLGTRLKPLTNDMPKCLTQVNKIPILNNALEILEKLEIEETVLVIGYLGNKIKERIGNKFRKMKISYVENNIYDKTNTSYSLWLGLKDLSIKDNLIVLEGDVFFEEELLKQFIKNSSETSMIVQKYNPQLDGSFVALNKKGIVTDWVHKNKRLSNFIIEDKFKTVNIHNFGLGFFERNLKPALKKHIEKYKGETPLEYFMQDIVKEGAKIKSFNAKKFKWFEIDTIEDLKIAEEIFKKN